MRRLGALCTYGLYLITSFFFRKKVVGRASQVCGERLSVDRKIAISFDFRKALKQIANGPKHLHALKLVYRDIKPQNALVLRSKAGATGNNNYRMLIKSWAV